MAVQAQLADGRILEFPDGTDPKVVQATVKRVIAASASAPEEGIGAATVGGFKRFGAGLETALGSFIDPEVAARRGLARQQEIAAQYAPGASLEKVKQAYEKEGLLSAAGEAISQVPGALAEQFPNIAATIAGGKAGAMAGTAVAPGIGTIVGGLGGAALPSLLQLYGSHLTRQEEETPGQISRTAALGAAIPGTALEVASTAIPLGRTFIGKILGPEAEKMLARGTSASLERAAKESVAATLARGTAVGALAEIPTEVTQQMLERLQAGLPLTTPDALAEYGEAAYGATLVGAPFGAGARAAGRPGARAEYAALKQKEDEAAFEKEKAAALAKDQEEQAIKQEEIRQTKERFGASETPILALPAPAKVAEPEKPVDLQNPIGNISREELAPEVLKYVDQYRKDMGMPRLKSFSVEDIRDAMTNINPEGEQAALDSILAFKTGFKGEESFSPNDVVNAAVAKNIAPETKGFADFLERVTGKRELETMTQPQLYAAFKSLTDLPDTAPGQQVVLPEGSNANRFTQKQYDRAVKYVNTGFQEVGGQPLAREVISQELMEAAGLESQRAADMLLNAALRNGDLTESRKQVFRTIDPKTGQIKSTYTTREKADAAAKKQKLDVQEQTLVSIAPKEAPTPSPRAPMPGGFEIAEQSFVAGEAPAGFAITPEGRMKPLVTILEEQDVEGKVERLQGLRRKEAEKLLKDVGKHEETVKKGRAALESMEARGETDTDGYKKAKAQQARAEDILGRRIESLLNRIEEYSAPLQAKPFGKKQITRKGFTVTKGGKTVGTFPTRGEAEQSILSELSDKELQDIVDSGKQGPMVDRAAVELENRKKPGIRVKKSPKTEEQIKEEQAKAEQQKERDERVQKLEELLVPMLSKFGLKDVALKIVDQIENGASGSYLDKLIKISLEADRPIQTMRHEALHALKELGFFTPQQWKALEREAKKTWVDKYLKGQMTELEGKVMTRFDAYKKLGLSEASLLEEAIADAFADFDGGTKPPAGMMAALFKRIKDFFAALKRALTGAGYESAEDIFGKIEAGKLEKKIEAVDEAAEKFSLREAGQPATRENVLAAMYAAQEQQPYMNCQLCVQMATGVSKLLDLPKVKTAKPGDIYTFNERKDMASHYAIDLGNGKVAEVEEWGEKVREVPLANVVKEYDEPSSIRRPPETAYTKEKFSLPETVAVDKSGKPLELYHATYSEFDKPKVNYGADEWKQFGFHVGPLEAAQNRLDIKAAEDKREGVKSGNAGANIIPVNLNIRNPLRLDENRTGRWGVNDIMSAIMEKADKKGDISNTELSLTPEDVDMYMRDAFPIEAWLEGKTDPDNANFDPDAESKSWSDDSEFKPGEKTKLLINFLKSLGYDSIVYKNKFEGGGDSYIAIDPEQVKSQFRPEGKFSLNTYFPTAKAAEDAAYKKAPPETKEFKRWFGASSVIEEGRPQVMYHASMEDFSMFRENRPIFISPDAKFAEDFIKRRISESKSLQYLSEGKEKTAKIYPLWVRAETLFDYDNPDHVQQIVNDVAADYLSKGKIYLDNNTVTAEELTKQLSNGVWKYVEDPRVQKSLKKFGFDSFTVKEGGHKHIAVLSANQVKSATGNLGEFGENKDIRFSLKNVAYHSGDLGYGRDTTLGRMDGGRSTGHFGTGVYFVGNQEKLNATRGARQDRPVAQVDLSEFNLATPRDSYNARRLHDALKLINSIATRDTLNKEVLEKDLDKAFFGLKMALLSDVKQSEEEVKKIIVKAVRSAHKDRTDDVIHTSKYLDTASTRVMKGLGFDGVDVRHLPDFDTTEYGTVVYRETLADKQIKYSLPTVDPRISERVDEVTTPREEKGFFQRITEAISPKPFSSLRQSYLNRYNQLSKYDKLLAERMGGEALLADQSAESAALMSDLASGVSASAMGFGDRAGGIPVYRGGTTIINRDVKGLVASLAPLAQYGNPKVYQYYQFWAGAKRGKRLMADGREKVYTAEDLAYADVLERQFPEFVGVQKDLIAFNNGIVQYMVDTQVLSAEQGAEYTRYADYIPFYRQMDGDTTVGPNIFASISGVRPPKKLKGGDAPLADFLETLVRNTQSSIEAGMKNAAANRVIDVVKKVADVPGVALERLDTQETGPNIINVLEKGKRVSYRTPDRLLVEAVGSLNMSELPFMGLISGPSNLLRNLVTKDPGFMMANLLRDSLSAYVTSGQSMTPIAGTMTNFAKALARKSPGYEALLDAGVIGGYELSQNVERSGEALAKDLDKKAGRKDPILMRPFTSLWEALEKGTTASDAATRSLVYERVLAETGNEAEALYRALEVMNFNRKGNSPLIRVLTAAVPFFNARLQGLDLFYRASTGNMNMKDAKAIQRKFWTRGATMMALSVMYYMMVADDEEYKKQEQETKDGNWIIPSLGIRIPIPFEVGVLFKTVPERITAYMLGNDTGKDLMESTKRNLLNTFAFNPIPQTVKPIVEAATNFNFFTMRPIVGQGMADVAPQFQVGPGTSKVAETIGKQLGISPMKVDQVLKGYTGTMGVYMIDATDLVMEQFGTGTKANKRFEQMPVIKRFALDPEARGNITAYYELKDSVDTFTRTSNLLEKTSKPEEFLEYVKKNAGVFAVKDYVLDLEKEMKEVREMRRMVTSSDMDGEQKKNLLVTLGRAENNLTANIQTVKKVISSAQ